MKTKKTIPVCKKCGLELPEKTKTQFCTFHKAKRVLYAHIKH